jgi:ribosome silencing factor RsfS/YbeB/iojap
MFKLRKAGPQSSKVADGAKPSVKKKLKADGVKPKAKPASKGRASSKPAAKGKPKLRALPKPHKENALRKRGGARPHDLGIGAHTIEPAAGTPETAGLIAARAAMDKKGSDVVLLDVHEISGLCDEMLVVSARSVTHLSAVADGVEEALRKAGERVVHRDGLAGAEPDWVLLDYGNLMVHIFRPEARQSYGLEAYYADAKLVAKWKND